MLTAILAWWTRHPWVVWWLTLVVLVFGLPDTTRLHPALRWIAAALWCASLVQGLRVTARRSVIKAGLIAAAVFLPDLAPMLAGGGARLLELSFGTAWSRTAIPAPIQLFTYAVGAAILTDYAARGLRRRGTARDDVPPRSPQGESRWLLQLKRLGRGLGMVGLVLLVSMASMSVKVEWAKRQTHTLCDDTAVGGAVAASEAKARNLGLIVWSLETRATEGRAQPATMMAWEGFMFARWTCSIEHADGTVLSKRTFFLD
ncbi:MAG: hypothetical protein HYV62_03705 [Candidatus Rokubacteria bacterium]|nr:hypothetical protein [Candidatus Rokubacteria bacterium]